MNIKGALSCSTRVTLLGCTALTLGLVVPTTAQAQNAGAAPDKPDASTAPPADANLERNNPTGTEVGPVAPANPGTPQASLPVAAHSGGVEEIIVTAQKREQRLQDVPIAITAISRDRLQANRILNVSDLSGLAPNVTVRQAAGSSQIPSFTSRGITSYGIVPGSDKEFSIYLDGVYLGSSHSLFDLPDIERIEVLRGPQGTLFGRNSTSGAVSVVTRDPAGTFGVHQDFTMGNYSQFRSRTSVDLPAVGPFSAYISYVHDERRGDIRNLGAGTAWDKTGPQTNVGAQTSPQYLGDKNQESVFAAVMFQPSDNFKTTYKFDYASDHYTAEGTAFVGYNPNSPLVGPLLQALIANQATPVLIDSSAKRPKEVNNSFVTPSYQKVYGHNLTSQLTVNDQISLKNIASYRYSYVNSTSSVGGLGGLTFTPQAVLPAAVLAAFSTLPPASAFAAIPGYAAYYGTQVGKRYSFVDNASQARGRQWSDELQANYTSQLLTVTVGGLYFHQNDRSGGPRGLPNNYSLVLIDQSGRIPLGDEATSYNKATSTAAYAQAELHATSKIDLVAGGRVTHDKKSGDFVSGGNYVFPNGDTTNYTDGTFVGQTISSFKYSKTKFTYSGGVNYKPTRDLLVYAKYSTGFVSGGSISDIGWKPETVQSAEGGVKADLFDRALRTNLALFWAKYKHVQSSQGGVNFGRPDLGTIIVDQGTVRAQGVEFEGTLVPFRGLALNASFGYTDAKNLSLSAPLLAVYGDGYKPTYLPKFTSNLSAQYESQPLIGDARLVARVDGDWRSKETTLSGSIVSAVPQYAPIFNSPARWLVNTRVAIRDLGPYHLEIAFWTRNLTNNKVTTFPLSFSTFGASSTFERARTYGLDTSLRF